MVIIVIGLYKNEDKIELESILMKFDLLNVEFAYTQYSIELEERLGVIKDYFNLSNIGVIHYKKDISPFHSGSIIEEISNYYISIEIFNKSVNEPYFFEFIDAIENSKIKNFILRFADEFDKNSWVRLEEIKIKDIKKRLFSGSVWEEEYLSLKHNIYFPENYHPLILKVSNE